MTNETQLRRTPSFPLLVFYGLGVTVGAGIFALVGEILGSAGDQAPLAFLVAGIIAGLTAISYMGLVAEFPRAGGEAVYVREGIGIALGRIAGLGPLPEPSHGRSASPSSTSPSFGSPESTTTSPRRTGW